MGRGFSSLLVIAFAAAALHALAVHQDALDEVEEARTFLVEQQALTNKAYDFETTFWQVVTREANRTGTPTKRKNSVANALAEWEKRMDSLGIDVTCGVVGQDYAGKKGGKCDWAAVVELNAGGNSVAVNGSAGFGVIANMEAGKSTATYIIPEGCGREY